MAPSPLFHSNCQVRSIRPPWGHPPSTGCRRPARLRAISVLGHVTRTADPRATFTSTTPRAVSLGGPDASDNRVNSARIAQVTLPDDEETCSVASAAMPSPSSSRSKATWSTSTHSGMPRTLGPTTTSRPYTLANVGGSSAGTDWPGVRSRPRTRIHRPRRTPAQRAPASRSIANRSTLRGLRCHSG